MAKVKYSQLKLHGQGLQSTSNEYISKQLQLTERLLKPQQSQSPMGKKIQNYILESAVGSGEFGKVYKAYNQKTSQTVAIKVIQIEKFRLSPKLEEFTINEINTLSKIQDSTHIVRFIEILKTANNYYFVYEFCNDGTLEERIKKEGRFSEQKALNYFSQLLKAFKMLVKNNIMHRDIKPSNILLNNGIIKLADFGFCKPMKDSRDLAQTMLGSPIYMAPEILKGQIYTMKADVWSLGVVLYQMLYGFCPFEERSIARLINLIEEATVTFPQNVKISQNVENLLRKMLVKDQFKRIEWKELFQYELFQAKQVTKAGPKYLHEGYRPLSTPSIMQNLNNEKIPYSGHKIDYSQQNEKQNPPNPFSKKHFQSVNTDSENKPSTPSPKQNSEFLRKPFAERMYKQNLMQFGELSQNKKQKSTPKYPPNERTLSQQKRNQYDLQNDKYCVSDAQNVSLNFQRYTQNVFQQLSSEKERKRSNTLHDIRDLNYITKDPFNQKKEHSSRGQPEKLKCPQNQICLRKTRSSPCEVISDVEKKILQSVLIKRQLIFKGVKMVQKFLSQSTSKLNVYVCCLIAKRVKELSLEAQQTLRKFVRQRQIRTKQNLSWKITKKTEEGFDNFENAFSTLNQELVKVREKVEPFQQELKNVHQPQDIIFLRYGEEQKLTQEKQGLIQLLLIDDYLSISVSSKENSWKVNGSNYLQDSEISYTSKGKRELLEQYQRRILRNI